MRPIPRCLYITDLKRTGEARLRQVVAAGCAAGVDGVLLREPDMDSGKLLALAAELRIITREHHAQLIIHSAADTARAIAADGLHLSAADIDEAVAIRRWLHTLPITISTSCHSATELQRAVECGCSFALLSPIFATASHPERQPLGVERFQHLAAATPIDVIALGGITTENRHQLNNHPIAAMRAIDEAKDTAQAVTLLNQ
ncbi:MAG: thiamine phosphate synthase [Mariprofundales bacterium]|nr:thiamine phosphate synthase [Mariprofundales bacterium]